MSIRSYFPQSKATEAWSWPLTYNWCWG